jgi:hypothetical protein
VLFRSVNERIEQQALSFGGADSYEFVCECSSALCADRITLTLAEYEHVRGDGARFVVRPGHEDVAVELVVERGPTFTIVEKDGAAGAVAEHDDPRAGDLP